MIYVNYFLGILIIFFAILIIFKIKEKNKMLNKISISNIEKKLNEFKTIKIINALIIQSNKANNRAKHITPIIFLIISIVFSLIIFFLSYKTIKIISSSIIISGFSLLIPYLILKYIIRSQKEKILNDFPIYAITLKNYTQVTNDIIIAFKKAKVQEPLSIHIERFNVSIEKGMKIYECFERLKQDINIKKINEFLTAAQYCYINGGDFSNLLDKYSKILTKSNLQKEKEKQKSFASKLVLYMLIAINIYLLFQFGFANEEYKEILTKTFIGETIININIISYFLIFLFTIKLNKMEE